MHELTRLGSFPALQITPSRYDADLVQTPANYVPGAHTLQFHNGATLPVPSLALVWCGTPSVDRTRFEQFAKELMENGYLTALSYAGFQSARFIGSFDGPEVGGTVLDSQLRQTLKTWLVNGHVPSYDSQTIFALMLPDGVTVQFDGTPEQSCGAFCAYHESGSGLLYTVQPATTCSGCNTGDVFNAACMTLAHEVAESVSDPYGTGWYEDSTGMENADIVAWIQKPYGPWTVQGYADPAGNNVQGAYQAPLPSFTPDPLVVADLEWLSQRSADAQIAYAKGDVHTTAKTLQWMDSYAQQLGDYLEKVQ